MYYEHCTSTSHLQVSWTYGVRMVETTNTKRQLEAARVLVRPNGERSSTAASRPRATTLAISESHLVLEHQLSLDLRRPRHRRRAKLEHGWQAAGMRPTGADVQHVCTRLNRERGSRVCGAWLMHCSAQPVALGAHGCSLLTCAASKLHVPRLPRVAPGRDSTAVRRGMLRSRPGYWGAARGTYATYLIRGVSMVVWTLVHTL